MCFVQNHICVCTVHEQHPAMTLIKQHGKVSLPLLRITLGQIEYASELHRVVSTLATSNRLHALPGKHILQDGAPTAVQLCH